MLPLLCTSRLVPTTLLMLHGLSPTWQAANEVKCSRNVLQHFFLYIIKSPKLKHYMSKDASAAVNSRWCWSNCCSWLTLHRQTRPTKSVSHSSPQGLRCSPLLSCFWTADSVNDNSWLTYAWCLHSIAAFQWQTARLHVWPCTAVWQRRRLYRTYQICN